MLNFSPRFAAVALIALAAVLASGCAVGPAYQRPPAVEAAQFKENAGVSSTAPADLLARGPWWQLFGDTELNRLAGLLATSNFSIAQSAAALRQAEALVGEQQAGLFPQIGLDSRASRTDTPLANRSRTSTQLNLTASWSPDLWGRVAQSVGSAQAGVQASAADLAGARLAAEGALAANYWGLRAADAQAALLASTVEGFGRSLSIAQNRFNAGIVSRTDVLQAQTQLANAQAELAGLQRQRARFEHAVAVLVGQAPSNFSLAPDAAWQPTAPDIPVGIPSALLQRRPDIAAAERRLAAANAQIGIARSAYFPNIGLNTSFGTTSSRIADLFSLSGGAWVLGLSAAQVIFNAGATTARVQGTQAAYDQTAARYQAAVLNAFREVEDLLSDRRALQQQTVLRQQAAEAANLVEQQITNRYRSGLVGFSEVIAAQNSALSAKRAVLQARTDQQATVGALVQALGGGL